MERIWIVFAKETIDNLRDRRSVIMALIYPFIGPLMVGVLIGFVGHTINSMPTSDFTLAVAGADDAPRLIGFLEEHGAHVVAAPEDPLAAVRGGEFDVVLIVKSGFAERFAEQAPAPIRIVTDTSRLPATMAMSRVAALLRQFHDRVAAERLVAKGLDPGLTVPLRIEHVNVAVGRNITGFFLNMLPPFIIFTIFVGGVYLAIDTTAGERERRSLEPLLTNPVARWELLMGKAAATFLFTMVALVIQLISFKGIFALITQDPEAIGRGPGLAEFATIYLVSMPLVLFAVSLQMIVATVTRSFKETQTYLGLLPLIPSLPGMLMVFVPIKAHAWMMTVPTLGQTVLFGQVIRGEAIDPGQVVIASVTTTVIAVILLYGAASMYRREQVVFAS
jgi:sodium transport system permease protein